MLGISGGYGDDEQAWADDINKVPGLIREHYPSAAFLVLIPVAGGPDHGDCLSGQTRVRESWQHKHVDNAIGRVIASDETGQIIAGPSPHVSNCNGYSDFLGHLTESESEIIGREVANFFLTHDKP